MDQHAKARPSPDVEEVAPDVVRIRAPLPNNPLRAINAYLIRGQGRDLLVDTGMNRPECLAALETALEALGVDRDRTDLFITHGHSDHIGLASRLAAGSATIHFNPVEHAAFGAPDHWDAVVASARLHGFPDAEEAVLRHPGKRYHYEGKLAFTPVREGDRLSVGRYVLRCVATPGHTPGHLCLYEPDAKLFFSGDHILDRITPNISGWAVASDPLAEFLASLDKVAALDIALVLPGHRNPIPDFRRRIAELKAHHQARLHEVTTILALGPQTAYQVAARMRWSISYTRWEDFPVPQQWFATGEALAHLLHLERCGATCGSQTDGVVYFAPKTGRGDR